MRIADFLGRGQESAQSLRHLVNVTGENSRSIRRQIELERRNGTPILSDNLRGYFLLASEDERERFVRSMRGRAHEILMTAAAVEQAAGLD